MTVSCLNFLKGPMLLKNDLFYIIPQQSVSSVCSLSMNNNKNNSKTSFTRWKGETQLENFSKEVTFKKPFGLKVKRKKVHENDLRALD